MGRTTTAVTASLSELLWSETTTSVQSLDPWYLGCRILFAYPGSWKLCASCSKIMCTAACHWAEGWGMENCYWLQLTVIYCPLEIADLQQTPEFQNSCIRQLLPVPLLSRWGERFLVILPPPPTPFSQNLPRASFSASSNPRRALVSSHFPQFSLVN